MKAGSCEVNPFLQADLQKFRFLLARSFFDSVDVDVDLSLILLF